MLNITDIQLIKILETSQKIYFIVEMDHYNQITNDKTNVIGTINKNEQTMILEDAFKKSKFQIMKTFFKEKISKKNISLLVLSAITLTTLQTTNLSANDNLITKHVYTKDIQQQQQQQQQQINIYYPSDISKTQIDKITPEIEKSINDSINVVIYELNNIIKNPNFHGNSQEVINRLNIIKDNIKVKLRFGKQTGGFATLQDFNKEEIEKVKKLTNQKQTNQIIQKENDFLLKNAAIKILLPISNKNQLIKTIEKEHSLYNLIYNITLHEMTHIIGATLNTKVQMFNENCTIIMQRKHAKYINTNSAIAKILKENKYNKTFFEKYDNNLKIYLENEIEKIKEIKKDEQGFKYLSEKNIYILNKIFNNTVDTLTNTDLELKQANIMKIYGKRELESLYTGYIEGIFLDREQNITNELIDNINKPEKKQIIEDKHINIIEKSFYDNFKLKDKSLMLSIILEIKEMDLTKEQNLQLDQFIFNITNKHIKTFLEKTTIELNSRTHQAQSKILGLEPAKTYIRKI